MLHVVPGDGVEVGAGSLGGVVSRENFFRTQGPSGDPLGKHDLRALGDTFLHAVANAEHIIFEQGDKAASEPEKIRCTNHEGLQELLQVSAGIQLGRDLKQLMQFVSLGVRGGVEFGVRHSHRPKPGNGGDQGLFFPCKNPVLPRIDEDRP